jgi:hypothetical protein
MYYHAIPVELNVFFENTPIPLYAIAVLSLISLCKSRFDIVVLMYYQLRPPSIHAIHLHFQSFCHFILHHFSAYSDRSVTVH